MDDSLNKTPELTAKVALNPLMDVLYSDLFPDVLQNYNSEQTKELLSLLVDCPNNIINKKGPLGGYTALHWMAIKNDLENMEFLVTKCKAEIDCPANLGETPLLICIKNNNIYTVDSLIKLGADLKVRDTYNRSILHWAAYSGKVLWFCYFQKCHGIANFNDVDQFLQNPLHIACASGFADLAKLLIESGDIDLLAVDINGNSILHMCARTAMVRTCWLITSKYKGETIRLVNTYNKQKQRPYDIIRNEKSLNHKKLKHWLKMEEATNAILLKEPVEGSDLTSKRLADDVKFHTSNEDFTPIEKVMIKLKLSTARQAYLEWLFRFMCPLMIVSSPVLINSFIIPFEYSVLKGLLGFGSLALLLYSFSRQKHRINHIAGYENAFYLGFFMTGIVHNYTNFFLYINKTYDLLFLATATLAFVHIYLLYQLITIDPGFPSENVKKSDGTSYDINELLKTNYKSGATSTKDSIFWLSEPTNKKMVASPYFCEACLYIQASPSKHCKLCQHCCCKFDHHCLFINKCVGLRNHRKFFFLIVASFLAFVYYLNSVYSFLLNYYTNLGIKSMPEADQGSLLYYVFADTRTNWMMMLIFIDIFGIFMVSFLIFFQVKFISLGYTQQFPQSGLFAIGNKKMDTYLKAFLHRLDNLHVFLFKSPEENEQLFYRQEQEYRSRVSNSAIPLNNYPKAIDDYNDEVALQDFLPSFDKNSISKIARATIGGHGHGHH